MEIVRRIVTPVLLGGLLAGCGGAAAPPDAGAASVPTTAASTAPSTPPAPEAAVAPPWPEGDDARVAALQERVDAGSQPWLLDPSEVALSFVAAAYGWTDAAAGPAADGTVEVTGPDGAVATLTLDQPARTGPTGIWVVTAAERG